MGALDCSFVRGEITDMTLKQRLLVYLGLLAVALVLSLVAVYSYGKWFSHARYWHGTIERVQYNQARLVRGMLEGLVADEAVLSSQDALAKMFSTLDNRLVVEVVHDGELIFSNDNQRFIRGRLLEKFTLAQSWQVTLSSYQPPQWQDTFGRWLKNPARWFQPSFDHITFPFLWFLIIHGLSLISLGFIVRSRYLQNDVLTLLRKAESSRSEP